MTDYLTINEAAEFLEISRRTFDNWKHKPRFPAPKRYSRRTIRYLKQDLQKWKENPQ